jgi:putative peptidoglycan lipid II flippase
MKLYRAFATVGGLTMISRLLGFVRDILIAAGLGTGAVADAFFVAFRFPNLFRRLFGEGAFNAAFVPMFAGRLESDGQAGAVSFAEEAMAALLFALLLVSGLCMATMPWLMLFLAPGFAEDPGKYDLAVLLTQIAFPYLTCMSLVALLSGVLNSLGRFTAAAAAPILLNGILIAAAGLVLHLGYATKPAAGLLLAAGVAVAGFAQLAMVWAAVRRAGLSIRIRRPRMTERVNRLVELGVPGLVSGGVTQINIVVGTIIASMEAGAVSMLYYADRLYQLPLGIVGVAVGVVLLPELARKLRAGDQAAAGDSQNRSLEFALMLTLPAAIALAIAAEPIMHVLFERGAFTASDTKGSAAALAAFAAGLPAFVLAKVLQPAYFAREDTVTPMRFATLSMVVNVIGSLVLFFAFDALGWMAHVGIAVATSLAGWVNALALWCVLRRRGLLAIDARLMRALPLMLLASLLMGAALWYAIPELAPHLATGKPIWHRALAVGGLVGAGALVYGLLVVATGVMSLRQIARFLGRA